MDYKAILSYSILCQDYPIMHYAITTLWKKENNILEPQIPSLEIMCNALRKIFLLPSHLINVSF